MPRVNTVEETTTENIEEIRGVESPTAEQITEQPNHPTKKRITF